MNYAIKVIFCHAMILEKRLLNCAYVYLKKKKPLLILSLIIPILLRDVDDDRENIGTPMRRSVRSPHGKSDIKYRS